LFWKLLLAFTVIPAVELYLLITIGQWIGPLATVLFIVLTGIVGAALAKREGLAVLGQVSDGLKKGLPPANSLVEGLLVIVGAALLVTPGVLTDIAGFAVILPFSRRRIAPVLKRALLKKLKFQPAGGAELRRGPDEELAQPEVDDGGEGPFEHPVA